MLTNAFYFNFLIHILILRTKVVAAAPGGGCSNCIQVFYKARAEAKKRIKKILCTDFFLRRLDQ